MNKVIVDDSVKGVVPYFQLPALQKTLPPAPRAPSQTGNEQTAAPAADTQGTAP